MSYQGIQYNIKHAAFSFGCYGRLPHSENNITTITPSIKGSMFIIFILTIALHVLWFSASDNPVGIFNFFLENYCKDVDRFAYGHMLFLRKIEFVFLKVTRVQTWIVFHRYTLYKLKWNQLLNISHDLSCRYIHMANIRNTLSQV
jgi:hypothetical protein